MHTATATSAPCPACQQALRHLALEGHYAKSVEVELCTACHLVWADWTCVRPLLDAVEPLLRAQQPRQAKPWGTRLREQQGDHRATQFHRWLRHANLVSRQDDGRPRSLMGGLLDWRNWLRLAVLGLVCWGFFR